jgi:uncharacterized membrane protein (DUF485 family)
MIINFKEKSPKERFLLVIGILFFLAYLALGLMIIFWKELPLAMSDNYRLAFGLLLVVYSGVRFLRLINSNKE